MKRLLLPLALLCSVVFTSCANRERPAPRPLGRYRYDPPDGNGNGHVYYGPSNYPGYSAPSYQYPSFRSPAKSGPVLSNAKSSQNFHGGPRDWYEAGVALGRHDRHEHFWGARYDRHRESYDHVTEADFARGYNDGYSGRAL